MSHLDHDALWAHARRELDEPTAAAAAAAAQHLASCADCQRALADVAAAQAALFALPEPTPMPDALARRVGHKLAELADAEAARRFTPWWQTFFFSPRFVLAGVTAALLALAGAWLLAPRDPGAPTPGPVALPAPTPAPAPTPLPAPAPAAKKLKAVVASAKRSTATKAQVLEEGARIVTQAGGNTWLKLPDGSRAGLTGTSEVTLATLEEQQLTLDVQHGSLALVVPHREDRVLTVRAGEVEVKDLGTRFLVSREPSRTLVAVEEGVVEVKTPAGTRQLKAGRAVTWRAGALEELAWETTPPRAATASAQPESIARLGDEDDDEPPPLEEAGAQPPSTPEPPAAPPGPEAPAAPDRTPIPTDEQWAAPPAPDEPQAAPAPHAPPPPTAVTSSERGFSLRTLERKLREVGEAITTSSVAKREGQAKTVQATADAGDCVHALRLAEKWLKATPSTSATEPALRYKVQLQKLRCLNHLGLKDEAAVLQRELDGR